MKLFFDLHIDASMLSLRFNEAVYVQVHYITFRTMGVIDVGVTGLLMSPLVAETIKNMPELNRQAFEAAKANAQHYWQNIKSAA